MADQEPTTSELGRWMGRLEDGLKDLQSDIRKLIDQWSAQVATVGLLAHRADQADRRADDLAKKAEELEERLRTVETAQKAGAEARDEVRGSGKRTATWIGVAFGAVSLCITVAGLFLK